jgi:hypothetical protein
MTLHERTKRPHTESARILWSLLEVALPPRQRGDMAHEQHFLGNHAAYTSFGQGIVNAQTSSGANLHLRL